jgi:hypothetical protein
MTSLLDSEGDVREDMQVTDDWYHLLEGPFSQGTYYYPERPVSSLLNASRELPLCSVHTACRGQHHLGHATGLAGPGRSRLRHADRPGLSS